MLDENTKNLPSENTPAEEEKSDQSKEVKDSAEEIEQEEIEQEGVEEEQAVSEKAEPVETVEPVETAETDKITEEPDKVVEEASEVAEEKVDVTAEEVEEAKESVENEPVKKESVKKESVKIEVPRIQFAKLSLDDLTKILDDFLRDYDIQDVKQQIEELKTVFTKKFKTLLKEKREEHVKSGGEEAGFYYESPVKGKFDSLIREYKRRRQQYYKDIEKEQKANLELKLKLIDELKELIDTAEPATMYKSFKELQDRWRAVGQIPRANYNDVWRTYHHHVERFYDLLHLNNDFRDLDFKHNLEEKTKLVERAEKLAQDTDVNHAFKELQILHRLWKEEIGPVAREYREEIWGRFSEATKQIHKKRHELQDKLEEKYRANVDLKMEVIAKIKSMELGDINSHKLWQDQIKKLEQFREEFFAIGKVPQSKSEEVWQEFRKATRAFNSAKNDFYKGLKRGQAENLKKKLELVEKAESLKDSEEWDEATEIFKKIQAEWKTIGHVPRKDSDKIWKRFKNACNQYFDRLHDKKSDVTQEQSKVIDAKKGMLDELKTFIASKDLSMDAVEEYRSNWRNLGRLPEKIRHLESKFNKQLDVAYKKLGLNKQETEFLKFKNLMDGYLSANNSRKLNNEQLFIRKRIDEITREIKQLENNISFISNASEDNPLVKNVYKNIENHKKELEIWKQKLTYLSQMDY
ncbi:MAG: DUF349 domain-containing protein [Lutimonas sp.]